MRRFLPVLSVATLALTACTGAGSATDGATTAQDKPVIVVGAYPLEFAVSRVTGDLATVVNLTPPGAEPHDLELSARDAATVADADLLVYVAGFQPLVDDLAGGGTVSRSYDAARAARLMAAATDHPDGDHADEDHADEHGGLDPHFWLDPTRLADVVTALGAELGAVDPAHAQAYLDNAASAATELTSLDGEISTALATCTSRDLVVSHDAFGYLAARYNLQQIPIAGLSPEQEPAPAQLAQITDVVRSRKVTTVFAETLVDPKIATTVASSTGARVATLDPIEGITDSSAGTDYPSLMRANLAALRTGLGCA